MLWLFPSPSTRYIWSAISCGGSPVTYTGRCLNGTHWAREREGALKRPGEEARKVSLELLARLRKIQRPVPRIDGNGRLLWRPYASQGVKRGIRR